jgi:hypothetical protein
LLDPWHGRIPPKVLVEVLDAPIVRSANPARKGYLGGKLQNIPSEFPFLFSPDSRFGQRYIGAGHESTASAPTGPHLPLGQGEEPGASRPTAASWISSEIVELFSF